MTERVKQLINDFKDKRWQACEPFERLYEIVSNQEELFSFLNNFIVEFRESSTLFDDGLAFLDEKHFKILITNNIDEHTDFENENIESLIAHCALQFPELLHSHLQLIFEKRPNKDSYYEYFPWRELEKSKIKYFKDRFESTDTHIKEKQRLFECLIQTRDKETIASAYKYALNQPIFEKTNRKDFLIAHIESVGFTIKKGVIASYCPNTIKHFIFPQNYFSETNKPIWLKKIHPSWKLNDHKSNHQFGGNSNISDTNPFFTILKLDTILDETTISGLPQLIIGVHANEMNEYGAIFYKHDNGLPKKLTSNGAVTYYTDTPILETSISLSKTPKRWRIQDWGLSNSRQNLFRFGGEPTWIQDSEVLCCPKCNEKMDFLMQLDSQLPTIDQKELWFGSGGLCYVFWCDSCKISGFNTQYT